MTETPSITVQEFVELALPVQTRARAASKFSDRLVTWCVATHEMTRAFAPGDFVLCQPPYTRQVMQRIAVLAASGVVGIALVGEPTQDAIKQAEHNQVPLFVLPMSSNLRDIEHVALALLLNRDAELEHRTAQLYQQLTLLSAENAGLGAMTELIARTTGKAVWVQDKRGEILARSLGEASAPQQAPIERWLTAPENTPVEFRDRRKAAQTGHALDQLLPIENLARLITPIVVKGVARGFFSLVGASDHFRVLDRQIAERSAAACAIEMAKAKAVSEAEKRVRGSFVDALLSGTLAPHEAMLWARRHKYDPDGRHTAIVVDWANTTHPSYRRLETVVHGLLHRAEASVIAETRDNEVVIFCRLEAREGIDRARRIADNIRHQAAAEFANDPVAIGIGRAVDTLSGLRDAYREARQALTMAHRLADPTPLYFGELNVYRLLFQLESSPELAAFRDEIIGALIAYDRAQGTDLIATLTAYFAHNANLSQTAEAMFVHRNTLIYRIERIKEIGGLDLDHAETRLSVQLALRAHRLLTANS